MSKDIEEILRATIQTKVVEAFNTTPEVIDKLVEAALSKEVNSYGSKPSAYDSRDKMPYMEWLVGEEIRKAVQQCVSDYVNANIETIKSRVQKSIMKADYGKSLADTVARVMSESYNWRVDFKISDKD